MLSTNRFTGPLPAKIPINEIEAMIKDAEANAEDGTTLDITFTLAPNSVYDANHVLNSENEEITISISGFSSSSPGTF